MNPVTWNNLITENAELKRQLLESRATLRDQFAMAALTGLIAKGTILDGCYPVEEASYDIADTMLYVRDEGGAE
jgi:hypothetical protein